MKFNSTRIFLKICGFLLIACLSNIRITASTGDTTVVQGFSNFTHQNCNTGSAAFLFPPDTTDYYKIMLRYELSCPPQLGGCDIYDRIATLKVLVPTGQMDSTLRLAPSFTVNGNMVDTFGYMNTLSFYYFYNQNLHFVDSNPNQNVEIIFYSDPQNPFTPTDTIYVWPDYYNQYVFDSSGVALDSTYVTPDSILYLSVDSIYIPFEVMEPYEIARAITPFGEGVVLWFDVSDYRMLLHDSVRLYSNVCGYDHGWNVTTDFYFIEGIPPMHPYKITNLWNGTWQYGRTVDPIENHLPPISLVTDSNSVFEKLRLITSGHGWGCFPNQLVAEFYDVTHTININGTNKPQRLWRDDCGRNPLYPQGAPGFTSTWFYNRANWCPGSYVTPHDYDVTPYIGVDDSLTVDYNMAPYTVTNIPSGAYAPEYYIQSHLISYDAINYTNNAAILEVRKPNSAFEYNRNNPICEAIMPEVLIKNYGTDTLTQLTINYGIDGNFVNTYNWTGNLGLTDTAIVHLPALTFGAGNHVFNAFIEQPNGNADEFVYDDSIRVNFASTNTYNTNYMRIRVRTDNSPGETQWRITDDQGTVVASHLSFTLQNSVYTDTVYLSNGCYNFKVIDTGVNAGDGICCYNGSGYLRIYEGAAASPIFNSGDYGEFYSWNFTIDFNPGIEEPEFSNDFFVYPNPASNSIHLNTSFESASLNVQILDMTGRSVSAEITTEVSGHRANIDLPYLSNGIYFLRIEKANVVYMEKVYIHK